MSAGSDRTTDPSGLRPHEGYAACVLIRKARGLVLGVSRRENPNDFGLPGGKPEDADADLRHTACRELFEETGVRVRPEDLREVFMRKASGHMTVTYEATSWTGEPRQQPGEGLVEWVTWDKLFEGCFGGYYGALVVALNARGTEG